jgi:SAM-dependent methyltransferase
MSHENHASATVGYDPAFFNKLDRVEDRHFWFRARKRAVGTVLRELGRGFRPGYTVLELGCGNGGMLSLLQQSCPGAHVFGMDLFREGLVHARHRSNCPLVQGDVLQPPFSEALDLVGMFDVLEHIQDDASVLRSIRNMLAPGGAICITVPAHESLWSYFDVAARHARRYMFEDLAKKLTDAGFIVEYQTEFMSWIYPLVWLGRRLNRYRFRVGLSNNSELTEADFRIVPGVNRLLDRALAGEVEMIRNRRRISLGVSILAVGRKPLT